MQVDDVKVVKHEARVVLHMHGIEPVSKVEEAPRSNLLLITDNMHVALHVECVWWCICPVDSGAPYRCDGCMLCLLHMVPTDLPPKSGYLVRQTV